MAFSCFKALGDVMSLSFSFRGFFFLGERLCCIGLVFLRFLHRCGVGSLSVLFLSLIFWIAGCAVMAFCVSVCFLCFCSAACFEELLCSLQSTSASCLLRPLSSSRRTCRLPPGYGDVPRLKQCSCTRMCELHGTAVRSVHSCRYLASTKGHCRVEKGA